MRIPKAKKGHYPIVEVYWEDIAGYSRWQTMEDAVNNSHPVTCVSYGVLLKSDPHLVVSSMLSQNGTVSDTTVIPMSNVKTITKMGELLLEF